MTRRSRGEGTAPYKVSDGRWRAEVVTGWTPEGRPRRKIVYGRTKALCADRLREVLNARDAGILTAGRAPTLNEWLAHWLEEIAAPQLRPRTVAGYRSYIRTWITPPLAGVRLDKVTPEHLDGLYARMRAAGCANGTVLQMHRILARALKIAVRRGRLAVSPASRVDPPPGPVFDPGLLSVDDARVLIRAAADVEAGVRWMLALALGLRQGERLGLGWDRVDLEAGTLRIDRTLQTIPYRHGCPDPGACPGKRPASCPQTVRGGMVFGEPKSRAGRRLVALPGPLLEALRAHREDQLRIRGEEGARWAPYTDPAGVTVDLVFCQRNGRPIHSRADWTAWQAFLASAGVAPVRVHDARHTAATVLLLMGVDPRVVMDVMGWSQVSMLARYQHVIDELKRSAADAVGAALWVAPPAPEPEPVVGPVVSLEAFRARRSG